MLLVLAMSTIGIPVALISANSAHASGGGPVILDGMDPGFHGFESGGVPQGPWVYIEKAYQNLMLASSHGTSARIDVLGAADSTASSSDCGAGAHYAAATDGYTVGYFDSAAAIGTLLDQLTAGTASTVPRLIHIVDTACGNGLDASMAAALTSHASDLAAFVSSGGALYANTENGEFYGSGDLGYDWLSSLLPGLTVTPDVGGATPNLSSAGQAAFPGLTNGDIQSPWHSGFSGTLASLQILATDGGHNVIIGGASVVLTDTLDLAAPAPPAGEVGAAYSNTITASGGTGPYTYAITAGALPDGLTLNPSTGVISGTPASDAVGTANFTVGVTDSTTPTAGTASQALSIAIVAAPTLSVSPPPSGEVAVAYADTLTPTDGTGPFTFSISAGALPDGLTLNPSTGVISGTPASDAVGTASFTVHIVDSLSQAASQALTLTIAALPTLSIPTPASGEVGASYIDALSVTGGTGPFTWSVTAGALPDGLTLNASTGVISGTPTSGSVGTANFTVHVTDSFSQTTTQALSLVIAAAPVLEVSPPAAGEVSVVYSNPLTTNFGTGPFTWSITAGSLPHGLTLNPSTGVISGTPASDAVGAAQFTVHVVDSLSQTANQVLTLAIAELPTLTVTAPPAGEVAVPYTNALVPTGGTGPFTWSVSAGTLPHGLTLDPATGVISGTPDTQSAGTAHFTVAVTDAFSQIATQALSITIVAQPTLPTVTFAPAVPTVPYLAPISVADGTGPFTWTLASGNLPPGLSLAPGSTASSLISGIVVAGTSGTYTFSIAVTDANGQVVTATFTITVLASQANSRLMATTPDGKGYWVADADGSIVAFGDAQSFGSEAGKSLTDPIVGMQATADGDGYWLVASDGGVFAFGDAGYYGSTGNIHLKQAILGMATTPDGHGYWLVASDGGVFAYGNAHFYGSTGGITLNRPVVGVAASPTGSGYWLVASDGGVFAFGDAAFHGSLGAVRLSKNVVGIAATPDGLGYWLVASDGGVFALGDAHFYGSFGGHPLNEPMSGISATPDGKGYWLVAADGGIFNFGDATFKGSRA